MLSIPYTVLIVFVLNILLVEIGAGDCPVPAPPLASVTQVGPVVTAMAVAGAGSTAMCADLGARTIREEIDAHEGDRRQSGSGPGRSADYRRHLRRAAALLGGRVTGLTGSYIFVVFVQHVTPGAFIAGMTLVTGLPQVVISLIKATLFGLSAGLIACYKGLSVGGGPTGVGNAVNETVVFSFMALFFINIVITALGVKVTAK